MSSRSKNWLTEEQEQDVIELLALIYSRINWKKMREKNPYDVFNHRVRYATSSGTIYRFVSKLGNSFGLQSIPAEAIPIIQRLRPDEKRILNIIRQEHILYAELGARRAKDIRAERKKGEMANEI